MGCGAYLRILVLLCLCGGLSLGMYDCVFADDVVIDPLSAPIGSPTPAQAQQDTDPIKLAIMSYFDFVRGAPGDYAVFAALILMSIALWRRMYKASVGMLVLVVGIVMLRVVIALFFD